MLAVAEFTLPDPEGSGSPVGFVLGIDPARRLTIGLAVGHGHVVDVSRRPGLLQRAARARAAEVAADCRRVCAAHGAWVAPDDASLAAAAGGAAFPLLGAAYEHGAAALGFVPRWAAPVLAEARPGRAAQRAFGRASTRATARALPRSFALERDRTPRLAGLGLARAGSEILEPDEIVAVLDWSAANAANLTTDDVRALRRTARVWGRRVVGPLLREVAGSKTATARLLDAVALWGSVGRRFDRRVPHRLDDLIAELRAAMPVDPGPPTGRPAGRPPASGTPSVRTPAPGRPSAPRRATPEPVPPAGTHHPAPPRPPARHVPRQAPTTGSAPPANAALPVDARLAPLDGAHLDRCLRLVLPRSTQELTAWGSRLDNCLGAYRSAALAGQSLIIGVEADGRLEYCVELTPSLGVRQFLGRRNRPPTPEDEAVVLAALSAALTSRRPALR